MAVVSFETVSGENEYKKIDDNQVSDFILETEKLGLKACVVVLGEALEKELNFIAAERWYEEDNNDVDVDDVDLEHHWRH